MSQLLAFALASILFIQVPGPSLLFTHRPCALGRSSGGPLSVVGNAPGADRPDRRRGDSGSVRSSRPALRRTPTLKVIGAGLGRVAGHPSHPPPQRRPAALLLGERIPEKTSAALRTGFIVGATNPKTIVFFVAFLPQFTNAAAGHVGVQIAFLGALFAMLAVASDSLWALAASRARDWFARKPQRLDAMGATGGLMMIGLGATLATTD